MSAAPLQGWHAIVTGAARDIGAAIAKVLAEDGAKLTLLGRWLDTLRPLADELPGEHSRLKKLQRSASMLHQEWNMSVDLAIEAQAQAICMLTENFTRAYDAFVAKQKPRFEGN